MLDTMRNGFRIVSGAVMNSEMVYSFLMGMGWFFLLGWAIALLVACASVFRGEGAAQFADMPGRLSPARLRQENSRKLRVRL